MTENTPSKKSIITRIVRWLIYGLTILIFVLATAHNDHLHKLNSDQFGPPDYYYDYYLHDSMWFMVAMLITLLMIGITDRSITARHQALRNRWPLVITGILFYLTILILLLDMTIGGAFRGVAVADFLQVTAFWLMGWESLCTYSAYHHFSSVEQFL